MQVTRYNLLTTAAQSGNRLRSQPWQLCCWTRAGLIKTCRPEHSGVAGKVRRNVRPIRQAELIIAFSVARVAGAARPDRGLHIGTSAKRVYFESDALTPRLCITHSVHAQSNRKRLLRLQISFQPYLERPLRAYPSQESGTKLQF